MPASRTIEEGAVQQLAAGLRGELVRPQDHGYDTVRTVFNGMIDKRPAMIVRCAGTSDVMRGVDFARAHDLPLAVRSGGHNVAGKAVCDGGLMLDLSPMKGMRVDPAQRTARAQPGLILGDFDRETQAFGLAAPLGVVSMTGIAGLTLGGGLGWLNGEHGLACDNLLSADVVTAEGWLLSASDEENEDLFWGSGEEAGTSASSPPSSTGSTPSVRCWQVGSGTRRPRPATPCASTTSSRGPAPTNSPPPHPWGVTRTGASWPEYRSATAES